MTVPFNAEPDSLPVRRGLAVLVMAAGVAALAAGMAASDAPLLLHLSLLSSIALGLGLLWLGAAPAWVAGQMLKRPWVALAAPAWALGVGAAAWALAWLGGLAPGAGGHGTAGNAEAASRLAAGFAATALVLMIASGSGAAFATLTWRAAVRCTLFLLLIGAPWLALACLVFLQPDAGAATRFSPRQGGTYDVLAPLTLAPLVGIGGAAIGHALRKPTLRRVIAATAVAGLCAAAGALAAESAGMSFPLNAAAAATTHEDVLTRWWLLLAGGALVIGWGQWSALLLGRYEVRGPARRSRAGDSLAETDWTRGDGGARGAARIYFALTAAYALFLAYGSLVPLDFQPGPMADTLDTFLDILTQWPAHVSRSDLVANIVLGVPVGFLAAGWLARGGAQRLGVIGVPAVLVIAALLGAAVEFGQMFVPVRTPSLSDVLAQVGGAAIGLAAWAAGGARLTRYVRGLWAEHVQDRKALKIIGGYAAVYALYQLLPFDITVRPAEVVLKIRAGHVALIPFADAAGLSLFALLLQAAVMLPIGYGVVVLRRGGRHAVRAAALGGLLVAGGLEALQLFVLPRYTSSTDALMGMIGGAVGGWMALRFGPASGPTVAGAPGCQRIGWAVKGGLTAAWLAAAVALKWHTLRLAWPAEGLWTRAWRNTYVPLESFYYQSPLDAAASVARGFIAFLILGLLVRSLMPRRGTPASSALAAALAVAATAVALEAAQLLIPLRTVDPASILIEAAGGIVGVLLYRPFVKTFVDGPTTGEHPHEETT